MSEPVCCERCAAPLTEAGTWCAACLLEFGVNGYPAESDEPAAPTQPEPARMLGECGDYELLKEIARGGMGVVCRARQKRLNRIVAVKLILNGHWANPTHTERFQAEAEAAARLDHPNIVPIYEVGEDRGQHFFSMKLIEGSSLAKLIAARATHSGEISQQREWARLLAIVARAVHYAHQRSVLHRDLKPTNILVDTTGQPHLTDFGLAKLLDQDSQLTHSASVLGTPSYMAPERAGGPAVLVTTAADIYSLGAILYAMLTGQPPFVGETPLQTLERVRNAEPIPPRVSQPGVDPDLETICLKCLSKEPDRRYGSAEALAEELERFLRGEPIHARPVGTLDQLARWSRRQPALAGLSLALFVALTGGLVATFWQWHKAQAAYESQERANRQLQATNEILRLQRAHLLLERGDTGEALPVLAQLVRQDPSNRVATAMLAGHLTRGRWLPLPEVWPAHTNGPHTLGFSPDSRWLFSWARDSRSLAVFPIRDGQCGLEVFRRSLESELVAADFSPDGRRLLVGLRDGSVHQFITDSGGAAGPVMRVVDPLRAVAFAEPEAQVATVTTNGALQVWSAAGDARTLGELGSLTPHVAFSPDGRFLAGAGADGKLRVWEVASARSMLVLPTPVQLRGVNWDARGRWLGMISEAPGVQVYALTNETPILPPAWRETAAVDALAFSADGTRLATAHADRTLRIWRLSDGLPVADTIRLEARLNRLGFAQADQALHGLDENRLCHAWQVADGKSGPTLPSRWLRFSGWALDPQGWLLAAMVYDGGLFVVELETRGPRVTTLRHGAPVLDAAFDTAGARGATAGDDGIVRLWNVADGKQIAEPMVHPAAVPRVAFSPDGTQLVTACEDGRARLWDAGNGRLVVQPLAHRDAVWTVAFSPDGRTLATGSKDGTARMWNLAGEPTSPALEHGHWITRIAFTPDGKRLVVAGLSRATQVWSVPEGRLVVEIPTSAGVSAIELGRDGRRLVSGHFNGTGRVWDAVTGKPVSLPVRLGGQITTAAFSPLGNSFLCAARDAQLAIWPVAESNSTPQVITLASAVVGARFLPDNRSVITTGEDGTVRMWDATTGFCLAELAQHAGPIRSMHLQSDGRRLITAGADGVALVHSIPEIPLRAPEWLPEVAETLVGARVDAHGKLELWDQWLFRLMDILRAPPEDELARQVWLQVAPPAMRRARAAQ